MQPLVGGEGEDEGAEGHANAADHGVVQSSFRSMLGCVLVVKRFAVVVDPESDEAADDLAGKGESRLADADARGGGQLEPE